VLAALTNALKVVGKQARRGAGRPQRRRSGRYGDHPAAAQRRRRRRPRRRPRRHSCTPGSTGLDDSWRWVGENTNRDRRTGGLHEALVGADVFIGVSAPNILTGDDLAGMNADAIVFALANPDPEVDPFVARQHAAVVATGRSDLPNQINNVLVFPGFFRGLLDAQARTCLHRPGRRSRPGHRGGGEADRAQRQLHHPQRVQPGGGAGRRRRRTPGRRRVDGDWAPPADGAGRDSGTREA
jgi:malate dehydrogenase (oxaloacetate-decarboxylating)